jgi:hypothetical protein
MINTLNREVDLPGGVDFLGRCQTVQAESESGYGKQDSEKGPELVGLCLVSLVRGYRGNYGTDRGRSRAYFELLDQHPIVSVHQRSPLLARIETYDILEELGELDDDNRSSKSDPTTSVLVMTVAVTKLTSTQSHREQSRS